MCLYSHKQPSTFAIICLILEFYEYVMIPGERSDSEKIMAWTDSHS